MENMSGAAIAARLESIGYKIKTSSKTSLVVMVKGNRLSAVHELVDHLKDLGAYHDKNAKGSSIGAVMLDKVKILVKADGKGSGLDVESQAIDDLQRAIKRACNQVGGPIDIKTPHRGIIKGIVDVVKTPGTPKSDFHLINEHGEAVLFISHKKGSTAKDFQQWGGMTEKAIMEHPLVQRFSEACRDMFGDNIGSGQSAKALIDLSDKEGYELAMLSIFGVDSTSGIPGVNCIDILVQGDPTLIKSDDGFELQASGHVHYYPNVPTGDFAPCMAIIYKGDRDNLGIKGARASIYPVGGRRFKQDIEV